MKSTPNNIRNEEVRRRAESEGPQLVIFLFYYTIYLILFSFSFYLHSTCDDNERHAEMTNVGQGQETTTTTTRSTTSTYTCSLSLLHLDGPSNGPQNNGSDRGLRCNVSRALVNISIIIIIKGSTNDSDGQ